MSQTSLMQSPLQLYKATSFAGMTEANHLVNAYMAQPEIIGSVLAYAFANKQYSMGGESVIELLTGGLGQTLEVENSDYQWTLYGDTARAIDVIENLESANPTPGYGLAPFRVKMSEKFFSATDNLRADDGTMVRVQSEPIQDGIGWIYFCVLASGDPSKFLDQANLAVGAKFSKEYSTVEEFSNQGGSTSFSSPYAMKNCLSTLRKQHAATRTAVQTRLWVDMFDPADPTRKKKTRSWITNAEWTFMAQWYKEKDKHMLYSEYNKNSSGYTQIAGLNGRPVYTGAGLRQQISPLNVRYYNQLSYNMLDNLLLDLSYNANKQGGNHKFVMLTGKMGMRAFSDAINNKFRSLGVSIVTSSDSQRFISGSGNELVFSGDQWTTAKFPNGVEVTVREFSIYDDIVSNRTLHPITGKPTESYRMSIFNFGTTSDGKGNIRKVVRKGGNDLMWSVNGSIDASGNGGNSFSTGRASAKDGYEIHALTEEGIVMMDPTGSAELIFSLD